MQTYTINVLMIDYIKFDMNLSVSIISHQKKCQSNKYEQLLQLGWWHYGYHFTHHNVINEKLVIGFADLNRKIVILNNQIYNSICSSTCTFYENADFKE